MKFLPHSLWYLLLAAILGATGCVSPNTISPAEPDQHIVMAKQFFWLKNLRSELITESDGTASVVLQGTSSSMQKHQLYIRTNWFKANGMPIESRLSGWERIPFLSNMPFYYTKAAPSSDAADYRILITDSLN